MPAGLQNRAVALYVTGGFDSHVLPPKTTSASYRKFVDFFYFVVGIDKESLWRYYRKYRGKGLIVNARDR